MPQLQPLPRRARRARIRWQPRREGEGSEAFDLAEWVVTLRLDKVLCAHGQTATAGWAAGAVSGGAEGGEGVCLCA